MTTATKLKAVLKVELKDQYLDVKKQGPFIYVTHTGGNPQRLNAIALAMGFDIYGEAPSTHARKLVVKYDQVSKGHIKWENGYEWFQHEGDVYRAPHTCVIDINTHYRLGARYECKLAQLA